MILYRALVSFRRAQFSIALDIRKKEREREREVIRESVASKFELADITSLSILESENKDSR